MIPYDPSCIGMDDNLLEEANPTFVGWDAAADAHFLFSKLEVALVEFSVDITRRTDEMVDIVNDGDNVAQSLSLQV